MYVWNIPLYLYPLNIVVFATVSLVFTITIICTHAERKTVRFDYSRKDFCQTFPEFVQDAFKFTLSIYLEFIGLIILVYLASLLHKKVDLGAFAEIDTFGGIIWTIGMGAGDVTKVTVGQFLGQRRYKQAENSLYFYQVATLIVAVLIVPIIYTSKYWIASFLTAIPSLHEELSSL